MQADIALCGSGLYEPFGDTASEHKLSTSHGDPTAVLTIVRVAGIDPARPCACATALDGMSLPFELP